MAISSIESIFGCRCGCWTGAPRVRRRSSMRPRPRPMATGARLFRRPILAALKTLRPDESIRLEQTFVRHGGSAAGIERGDKLPPQCAGLKFFKRVRPQRIPQGHDDERAGAAVRRHQVRPRRAIVQIPIATASRTATSAAISSSVDDVVRVVMWLLATPVRRRAFQCRHRPRARSFKDLMLSAYAALGGQRREYPIYRHAGTIRGSYQLLHRERSRSTPWRRL